MHIISIKININGLQCAHKKYRKLSAFVIICLIKLFGWTIILVSLVVSNWQHSAPNEMNSNKIRLFAPKKKM